MKKIKAFLIIIIFLGGIGYHFYTVISLNGELKALKFQKNISLELENNPSKNELDYYKKLTLRTVNLLTEEQLTELSKLEWHYKLLLNGEEFKGQNIKIDGDSIQIIITENREENSILPDDLRMEGQLDTYFKQISIESRIEPEITNKDEAYTTSVLYKFPQLSSGDKIKISMSEELSKRLGLSSKTYVIQIQ
ncbi:MAG: hypothetical protein K0R09_2339 [Clostridiales bacterium]|jgi:hypothetical protein|nr:hypothetical protein [Clostridiales bacterium]